MKAIFSVLTGLLLFNLSACDRVNDRASDDITIERQEDYETGDTRYPRDLPLDNDVVDDEVEIDD